MTKEKHSKVKHVMSTYVDVSQTYNHKVQKIFNPMSRTQYSGKDI